MEKMYDILISKFISGKRLDEDEYILLDKLFNNSNYHNEVIHWLENNWQQSKPETVGLQFQQIREKIRISSGKRRMSRLFIVLSRAAAVLFIPLLAAALYFYLNQNINDELLTLSTQKGEQTSVILPDGSKVWLNVDTKLSYPVDYGVNSRNIKLEGEAYFEVEKNLELPFEVTSGNITTKAIGTCFVVSAYPESSVIKSSLINGSVDIKCGKVHQFLKPGQQLVFNKNEPGITIHSFDENYVLAWKNKELTFHLTPFDNVIHELEKWYNIDIEYNPGLFKSETLTVRFEKYETLEQVLLVISKTNGFEYIIKDKQIKILRKDKK